jgi:hypothetical protein
VLLELIDDGANNQKKFRVLLTIIFNYSKVDVGCLSMYNDAILYLGHEKNFGKEKKNSFN